MMKFKKVERKCGRGTGQGDFTIQAYLAEGNNCTGKESYLPQGYLTKNQAEMLFRVGVSIGTNHIGNMYVENWIFPYRDGVSLETHEEWYLEKATKTLSLIEAAREGRLIVAIDEVKEKELLTLRQQLATTKQELVFTSGRLQEKEKEEKTKQEIAQAMASTLVAESKLALATLKSAVQGAIIALSETKGISKSRKFAQIRKDLMAAINPPIDAPCNGCEDDCEGCPYNQ